MQDNYSAYRTNKIKQEMNNDLAREIPKLKGLWAQVMAIAIADVEEMTRYKRNYKKVTRQAQDAEGQKITRGHSAFIWIFNGKPAKNDFVTVCALLEIEPDRVRAELKKRIGVARFVELSQRG